MIPSDHTLKAELAGLRYLLQAANSQDVISEQDILPIMRDRCRDVLRRYERAGRAVTKQNLAETRDILEQVEARLFELNR